MIEGALPREKDFTGCHCQDMAARQISNYMLPHLVVLAPVFKYKQKWHWWLRRLDNKATLMVAVYHQS